MKLILFFTTFTFIFLSGCNRIDKKDLIVIEGIELGTTIQKFYNQIDSLGIKTMTFNTKAFNTNINEIKDDIITAYISDIFNFSNYMSDGINHYAMIIPVTLVGTDNVFILRVLIGHTSQVILFDNGVYNLTKEFGLNSFNQNISVSMLNEIKSLFNSKYGNSVYESSESTLNQFYVLEGNKIKEYIGTETRKGKITTWETDCLNITLFEGLPSVDAKYHKGGYAINLVLPGNENNIIKDFDSSKGETPCVSFVYIEYTLKNETLEKLGLSERKI